ncbi:MAG: hypothetical protein RI906_151 [Pseudomonadota bacterium]
MTDTQPQMSSDRRTAPRLSHFFWALFIPALLTIGGVVALTTHAFDKKVQAQAMASGLTLTDGLAREFAATGSSDIPLARRLEIQPRIDGVVARFSRFDRILVLDPNKQIVFDTQPRAKAIPLSDRLAAQASSVTDRAAPTDIGPHKVLSSAITAADGRMLGTILLFVDPIEFNDYRWKLLAELSLPATGLALLTGLLCLWPTRWIRQHIEHSLGSSRDTLQTFVLGEVPSASPVGQRIEPMQSRPQSPDEWVVELTQGWQRLESLEVQIQRQVKR